MLSIHEIKSWLMQKRGVLTTRSAFVCRESYFGNSIIAPNSSKADADQRGFVPVELWIMSVVENANPLKLPNEGITKIKIGDDAVLLTELRDVAGELIFGKYADAWPLAKIIDIGGSPVTTSFGTTETTPIPVHVHGGTVVEGHAHKPGKTEAYFFPPTDVPPYDKKISAHTRIGLKAGVTKDDFRAKLREYGENDSMYTLLNEFPITPMTGWTVPEGVLHAPGPYITFEIQRPQDDCNFAAWKLGNRLTEQERHMWYQKKVLKGLADEDAFIDELLDWPLTTSQDFEKRYFHDAQLIEEGEWGTRHQIFFDMFYGEGWEVLPGKTFTLPEQEEPHAGVVWSGKGTFNGTALSQEGENEFLCTPQNALEVSNTGDIPLLVYTVKPMR